MKRLAVVGGGRINGAFLAAGLLDEISLIVGAGVDGRAGMTAVFDGLPKMTALTLLSLKSFEQVGDNSVWIRYTVGR